MPRNMSNWYHSKYSQMSEFNIDLCTRMFGMFNFNSVYSMHKWILAIPEHMPTIMPIFNVSCH